MVSDAQKKADAKYKKEKTHTFLIRFFPADEDIWEHLRKQEMMATYIKELIRKDMVGE